jgi:hypothetical protein
MKKNLTYVSILLLLVMLTGITSCKKDSVNPCKVKSIIYDNGSTKDTTTYSYNNDGNLITQTSSGYSAVYSYYGSSIIRTSTSGSTTSRDSIVLNSNGLIKERYEYGSSGELDRRIIYTYDSNNNLSSFVTTNYPALTTETDVLAYSDGDMITDTNGSDVGTYEYYSDKSSAIGDYIYLFQLSNFGAFYIKTKHLLKTQTNGPDIYNYSYTFNADGTVSGLTITHGSDVQIYALTYICN